MLYKVCMAETFAEEPSRVGIIQADTLAEASAKLRQWVDTSDWGDYSRMGAPLTEIRDTHAVVGFESNGIEGRRGVDLFIIRPVSEDVFMFLIEDWPYVFARLERHL